MPFIAKELEKREIDIVSSGFYFAGVVKNILQEMRESESIEDFSQIKELIIRYMLD